MSSSASTSQQTEEVRPEADPLPRKLGEFGYVPPTVVDEMREVDLGDGASLPARHPADRDTPPSGTNNQTSSGNPGANSSEAAQEQPPQQRQSKAPGILGNRWHGIQLATIFRILFILACIAGTGVGWILTYRRFSSQERSRETQSDNTGNDVGSQLDQVQNAFPFANPSIFVHIAFIVITLFLIVFLERAIFQLRAERYIHKHGMSRHALRQANIGIAPWNRPPLPTYAAALAESGHGTGDVEDNMIAIAPPPAYGNTRDSTLLLSSFLSNSLMRSFSRTSTRSREARLEEGAAAGETARRSLPTIGEPLSRPISYGASEQISDAQRTLELERALAKLEASPESTGSGSGSADGNGQTGTERTSTR